MKAKAEQIFWIIILLLLALCLFLRGVGANEITGTASWYSEKSVKQEGSSGVMANGNLFDDTKKTCASWDYNFGTILRVTNQSNQKSVLVKVTDRGPAKRLYRQGRIIDLSRKAFSRIANLKQGVVSVKIEVVK